MAYGKISDKQREILEYIKKEILNKGYPPTVRDICEAVHLKSTSSVHSHLETLEKNGYIRRDPTKPRAIEIVDDNFNLTRREVVNVPMIGQVAAGQPMLAVENIDAYFPIPAEYMPNAESFMLKVKGESMVNAGIFDGDNIIVERCSTAQNGEMVVALVDDSATVKTFYKEDGHIRLQPEMMRWIRSQFRTARFSEKCLGFSGYSGKNKRASQQVAHLQIDSIAIQQDSISKQTADFALVTFAQSLKLTENQKKELIELLNEKYMVSDIKSIDDILYRIKSAMYATNEDANYFKELDTLDSPQSMKLD